MMQPLIAGLSDKLLAIWTILSKEFLSLTESAE